MVLEGNHLDSTRAPPYDMPGIHSGGQFEEDVNIVADISPN